MHRHSIILTRPTRPPCGSTADLLQSSLWDQPVSPARAAGPRRRVANGAVVGFSWPGNRPHNAEEIRAAPPEAIASAALRGHRPGEVSSSTDGIGV
jgi:hypothetical protein